MQGCNKINMESNITKKSKIVVRSKNYDMKRNMNTYKEQEKYQHTSQ